jgi:hypothetical protein
MIKKEQIIKNLERQLEYSKYLYELERKRTSSIVDGIKIYLVLLSLLFGSLVFNLFDIAIIKNIMSYPNIEPVYKLILIFIYCISIILFLISLGITIIILKPWNYERLADPEQQLQSINTMQYDTEQLMNYIADFSYIANKTNDINNKRASLLSYSLFSLFIGVILLIASYIVTQIFGK